MDNQQQLYKKFLLQKSILDSLRVYIDLNETFLEEVCKKAIITTEELQEIKSLQWPRSRNEFLQCLVKKTWNAGQMDAFFTVLHNTQDSRLAQILTTERDNFIKENQLTENDSRSGDVNKNTERAEEPLRKQGESKTDSNDLDKLLNKKNMSMQDQNAIRKLLNDRDTEIFQLKIENQELRKQIKELIAENTTVKNRNFVLDKATTDLLACVDWDVDTKSVSNGLQEIKTQLITSTQTIKQLKQTVAQHVTTEEDLKQRLNTLTDDNVILRELKKNVEESFSNLETKYQDDIADLTQLLEEEREIVTRLKTRQTTFETRCRSAITQLQEENRKLKEELEKSLKLLKAAGQENDKVRDEMSQINDKTRKLLVSLDLGNDCDDMNVSLDFARNIAYTRRRFSTPLGGQKLAPLKLSASSSTNSLPATLGNENGVTVPQPQTLGKSRRLSQGSLNSENGSPRRSLLNSMPLTGSRTGLSRRNSLNDVPEPSAFLKIRPASTITEES